MSLATHDHKRKDLPARVRSSVPGRVAGLVTQIPLPTCPLHTSGTVVWPVVLESGGVGTPAFRREVSGLRDRGPVHMGPLSRKGGAGGDGVWRRVEVSRVDHGAGPHGGPLGQPTDDGWERVFPHPRVSFLPPSSRWGSGHLSCVSPSARPHTPRALPDDWSHDLRRGHPLLGGHRGPGPTCLLCRTPPPQ